MVGNDRPLANPVVVLREEFDDWAVLFNPDTAMAMGINPMGVAIWKKLDGKRSLSEVVDAIRHDYRDVPESVDEDVSTFVNQLAEQGFVGQVVDAVAATGAS